MRTLRVFISQPMRGIKNEVIEQQRKAAEEMLTAKYGGMYELIFLDSNVHELPPVGAKGGQLGAWYLGKSIEIMSQADIVYFCPGWEEARGCMLENQIASLYDTASIRVENCIREYVRMETHDDSQAMCAEKEIKE